MRTKSVLCLLVGFLSFGTTSAWGQVEYRLSPESEYTHGCFPPCLCPISLGQGFEGTFTLIPAERHKFRVENVALSVEQAGSFIQITGAGTYRLQRHDGGVLHRMRLKLRMNDGPIQYFDSGLVPNGGSMPNIDITVSMNDMVCLDTVMRIVASPASQSCGGIVGEPCADDEFCKFPPGTCNIFDNQGACTPIPQFCPLILAPVCGCDGETYGNACLASQQGVSIDHPGQCETGSEVCGGIQGIQCSDPNDNCIFPPGTCEVADNQGTCVSPSPACPLIFAPVCGCDGKTYGNACLATQQGVSIDHEGACGIGGDECFTNADCTSIGPISLTFYCKKENGNCDGAGVCTPNPQFCTDIYAPVCGCDGKTYSNKCDAAAQGVNVAHEGTCDTGGEVCGGIQGIQCSDPNDNCIFPPGTCDVADNQGICVSPSPVCPLIFAPVCGCDGKTYGNACLATQQGISIDHEGACNIGGDECLTNADCVSVGPISLSFYCDKQNGDCDGVGVCTPNPQICTAIYAPVCGCDGRTYGNECQAAQSGVNVAHQGPCDTGGEVCGGIQGIQCSDPSANCIFPPGTCDVADNQGICLSPSPFCPLIFAPVCGCDGQTYGNACLATRAGVSIDHAGACNIGGDECLTNADCQSIGPISLTFYCNKQDGDCDGVGTCTPNPQICIEIFAPVCGCDGQTYDNECFAAAASVNVAHEGPCDTGGEVCGGFPGVLCSAPGDFCKFGPGECQIADNQGICTPTPIVCPLIFAPVCGCDGVTYGNECMADQANVSIDHEGACDTGGEVCGGIQGIPCPSAGDFCKFGPGECQIADNQGICTPTPVACPLIFAPVCGCDGVTYGNACLADQANVSIDHPGACDIGGEICGGFPGIPCTTPNDFCKFGPGECQIADNQGICTPTPIVCPLILAPVCGCDGVTYGNECMADQANVSIDHSGACDTGGEVCGGIQGIPCPSASDFCKFGPGECQIADNQGICTPTPILCPLVLAPVCGCDGVTYGNQCMADQANVSIDHPGACDTGGNDCVTNVDCVSIGPIGFTEYCKKLVGNCDGPGVCTVAPQSCLDVYIPVCGCDGNTYSNGCYAARAGVSVKHDGPCLIAK